MDIERLRRVMTDSHYRHLAALSFVSMYVLIYAMTNSFDDVYINVNQDGLRRVV